MKFLPQTESKSLQATIVLLCTTMLYLLYSAIRTGSREGIIVAVCFLLPNTVGLWLLKEPARRVVSATILLLALFMPIGIINPFAIMDGEFGSNPPEVWKLVLAIFPWVAIGLFIVHILGKHKGEFTPLWQKDKL